MMLQESISLTALNTFGFESVAEFYTSVSSESELVEAVAFAKQNHMKWLPLGGGSNILVPEQVKNALVIQMNIRARNVNVVGAKVEVTLGAGENWHDTVEWCVGQGFSGIETMALIPGQVGAAPVQNIGAYGTELKDVLVSVRAYDTQQGCFIELTNSECQFSYRDSLFKRFPGRYLITSVSLCLSSSADVSKTHYRGLDQYFQDQGNESPDLRDVFDAVCSVRRSKLPDPQEIGNAGSFFKNPMVSTEQFHSLKKSWPQIVAYPENGQVKLAAGWLIDQCGWKGHVEGSVGVYSRQALVLINHGGGSLDELMRLADNIKNSVYKTFAVKLEIEPQLFV